MMREFVLRLHIRLVTIAILPLVRFLSLRRVLRLLTPPSGWRPYRGMEPERLAAMVRWALRAPRRMRRRACLREGLALFHVLCLAGVDAELNFAVYPPGADSDRMHGHCWVTVGGEPLNSPPETPFVVLWQHASPRV
jgi:hypothetical protein